MGKWVRVRTKIRRKIKRKITTLRERGNGLWKKRQVEIAFVMALLCSIAARAQDGNAGINQANTMVRSYFATGVQLMYAIGAILGLIGAVRV